MVDNIHTPEWRLVPGYPDYEISSVGIIRRVVAHFRCPNAYPAGYVVPQWVHVRRVRRRDGQISEFRYLAVSMHNRQAGTHDIFVHRAVSLAFIGPQPTPKHQVAHNDGDRFNNSMNNLRWATGIENQADRIRHGTSNRGSRHGMSKLSETEIRMIRACGSAGERTSALAKTYAVSTDTVRLILKGSTWKHVT